MFRSLIVFFIIFNLTKANEICDFFENTANNISQECLEQMKVVCNNPKLGWKFFDASSKFLTSGMSYSGVIDLGNFPECLSIDYKVGENEIFGKFCALSVIIINVFLTDTNTKILTKFGIDTKSREPQVISENLMREIKLELKDSLVPNVPFILSKYSSCVPNSCTPKEVGHFFWYANIFSDKIPLIIYTDLPCETKESNTDYNPEDVAVITFFALIVALMIASSLYNLWCQNFQQKPYHPLLLAFSVLYNGKKLLYVSSNTSEQIQVFNGMRFISMMWVVAYHADTFYAAPIYPLVNSPEAQEWNDSITNRYILSGLLSVDTFFFISGFLLAFSYIKSSADEPPLQQLLRVPKMYLHRYLRLTPSAGAMFLVAITFFRFLGSGPVWSMGAKLFADTCKEKWWKFFLYIQNYTDPDEMCVNPMWYLSADMQMFILAPIVLIPVACFIKKKFRIVLYGLSTLTILSILIPMLFRYFVDQEAGNIYTSHERFNNFLIGITFGAVMRLYKHKPFIFSSSVNIILWIVVLLVSLAFNLYWFDVLYNYTLLKYTIFMGLYRPVWCLCLVFMVYSCYHNQGGIIQWFLSLPSFQILGRLSYSMYILHVLVEVYAGTTSTTLSYFSNYLMFYKWCGHMIVTMILSVFWVLAFEYPMLTIDKFLLGDDRKKAKT